MRARIVSLVLAIAALVPQPAAAQLNPGDPVQVRIPLTEEMIERGVHGTVHFRATVDEDNRIASLSMLESSGSSELDQYAESQLLGGGVAAYLIDEESRSLELEVDLYAYEINMFVTSTVTCEQAVREHDWYRTIKPDGDFERGKLYNLIGGLAILSDRDELHPLRRPESRDPAWRLALEVCRERPESPFLPMVIRAGMELRAQSDD